MRRIYLDAETGPLIVTSWGVGRKINLSYENIVQERQILCLCWKVEGENKVNSLQWSKRSDKKMLIEFEKAIRDADELVGHNIKAFDMPWIRARMAFHDLVIAPDYKVVDTLTMARRNFRFVSNRLDYLGQFLGFGGKEETGGYGLWKEIVLNNSEEALRKMVKYCCADVRLVEQVYNRLSKHVPAQTHLGVMEGKEKWSCPRCASTNVRVNKTRVTARGVKQFQMQCAPQGHYFTIGEKTHEKYLTR